MDELGINLLLFLIYRCDLEGFNCGIKVAISFGSVNLKMIKMKIIKPFGGFISEGKINDEDVELNNKLKLAMTSNFRNVEYQMNGKDDKYYDYKNGHIHISNRYQAQDWSWLDNKRAKILEGCNFKSLYIKSEITYTEVISDAKPREPRGYIGVAGDGYINNIVRFDISDPSSFDPNESVRDFIKKSQESPINDDMLKRLLMFWGSSKSDYKTINTRDQGIGRHASIHITKSYNKAYIIKDLNVALDKTEEETENVIRQHYMFKKDKLDFDWEQGVMIVGGTYTEVWD